MKNKLGYLEEAGYAAEGGVIRHGEVLRDILVDGDEQNRVLGMIGLADLEFTQIDIVNGSAPMAYMIVMFGENFQGNTLLKGFTTKTRNSLQIYKGLQGTMGGTAIWQKSR